MRFTPASRSAPRTRAPSPTLLAMDAEYCSTTRISSAIAPSFRRFSSVMMASFRSPAFIVIESVVQIVEQLGRARSKVEIEMRKRKIAPTPASEPPSSSTWLDVEHKASVEVTSEENGFPIESALLGVEGGWRAADAGTQTIRLIFDGPQRLRRI